jgi:hypothetical protein
VTEPESFLVDKSNHLLEGEEDRGRRWGSGLAKLMDTAEKVDTA